MEERQSSEIPAQDISDIPTEGYPQLLDPDLEEGHPEMVIGYLFISGVIVLAIVAGFITSYLVGR